MSRLHSTVRYVFALIAASAAGLIAGHMASVIYNSNFHF